MINESMELLEEVKALVHKGFDPIKISKDLGIPPESSKELYEIALAQIRYKDKFTKPVLLDLESARLATHEVVADYHARRLKTSKIVDMGCGVGIQLAFFGKYSNSAIGVELNERRAEFARINAKIYGVDNVKVIVGDIFSKDVIERVKDSDIAFSDPARPYNEPVRTLDSCVPDPRRIIRAYSQFIGKFAFDLPPQIRRERVDLPKPIEFEYISLGGQLNRMTAYLGELHRTDRSAVILPGEERLEYDPAIPRELETSEIKEYVYDVDGAVLAADLLPELQVKTGTSLLMEDKRRALFTSDEEFSTGLFRARYLVVGLVNDHDLVPELRKNKIGRVVIRYSISPSRYYSEKRRIESELYGDRTAYLFRYNGKILICEKF